MPAVVFDGFQRIIGSRIEVSVVISRSVLDVL
jgi:hypothetical protein